MNIKIYENKEFDQFELIKNEADGSQGDLGALPVNVLSVVKGPSFVPDGYSRNGRFYPKDLWENSLKNNEFKSKMERRLVFGCIGHPTGDYTLDELLESGKVSHIVTDMKIDGKQGICEFHILDTPSGRILDAVLKAGSKPYVSTRAFGGFTNETKEKGGKEYKVLDKNNFFIESVDFVIDPGFLEASPKLMESLQENFEEMAKDPKHIKCDEGLCLLAEKFSPINEEKENIEEEITEEMGELLDNLSTDELKEMVLNISKENKKLLEATEEEEIPNEKDENEEEKEKEEKEEAKLKKVNIYLSYVELLIKLLKYDVKYEKTYNQLIEFLDKDDILSMEDITKIKELLKTIKEADETDESIVHIIDKLEKIEIEPNDGKEDKKTEAAITASVLTYFENKIVSIESLRDSVRESALLSDTLVKSVDVLTSQMEGKDAEHKQDITTYIESAKIKDGVISEIQKDAETYKITLVKLESELKSNRNLLEEKDDIIEKLKSDLDEDCKKKDKEDVEEDVEEAIEMVESLSADKISLMEKINDLSKELEEKEFAVETTQEKFSEAQSIVEQKNSKLKNEVKETKEALSESVTLYKGALIENLGLLFPRLERSSIESVSEELSYDMPKIKEKLTNLEKRIPKQHSYDKANGIYEKQVVESKSKKKSKFLENLTN